ncbi:hypothetical protein LTI14_10660 [Nesterenkonia sp. YGD6]|uniref:B3/B4 domain-containing protein n=1 Tax=Nesterenkonia sp. YGD6 TaxID=2901231 RepID=UPI001F4C5DCD|nr:phenylalanine--tRNA ligase beta subunit-related protein [Nesterenkonia sp. YGD6]MCH8563671.1 hypothetical protein [Nesterenkonia sp. YGD6]
MPDFDNYENLLPAAWVDAAIFELHPDYQAVLLVVDGIVPGDSDEHSEGLLGRAEQAATEALAEQPVEELPRVASWREAYRSFGTKPQKTRNSLEALLRRSAEGLPRVNRLTDIYNAVSVAHQIPLGGEDLSGYTGAPRLVRATGEEPFEIMAQGEPGVEYPKPGEVVWCDEEGVTCRRWNWRQSRRTQLTADTTSALFILDGLDPITADDLNAAADDLVAQLSAFSPDLRTARRLISAQTGEATGP